jgi:hypothetical protein
VIGGLYGNTYALAAILERAVEEPTPPKIVFNGDFHYSTPPPGHSARSPTGRATIEPR